MTRAFLVVGLLLGLSTHAHADRRDAWTGVLVGSVAVAAGGAVFTWHEFGEIQRIRDDQCDHGVEPLGHEGCNPPIDGPWTEAQIVESNEQGRAASWRVQAGMLVTTVGVVSTGVALYKVLTVKPSRKEDKVVVVPTVSTRGAGASLTLRW